MTPVISNIVIIGSGNVAWHFLKAFTGKGIRVSQVLARNEHNARSLSSEFSVPFVLDVMLMDRSADLYILAIQDDEITPIASKLNLTEQLLVHTSGFSSLSLLQGASLNTGVIWPLQTLTAGKEMDYHEIPFFIEANSQANQELLRQFIHLVSRNVIVTDSSVRQKIHLAAVIASNFTYHLYAAAGSILEKENIPFEVLAPLIHETAAKAGFQHPSKSQTGPAARRDLNVISKHLEMLSDEPEFCEIYRLITNHIIKKTNYPIHE